MRDLGDGYSTIQAKLKEGRDNGLFHIKSISKGIVTICYACVNRILRRHDIVKRVRPVIVTIDQIKAHGTNILATWAVTQTLQHAAYCEARKQYAKERRTDAKVRSPEQILSLPKATCHYLADGRRVLPFGVTAVSSDRVYLGADSPLYGVSQQRIASELGISVRTVQRHLKTIARKQLLKHYPQLEKVRGELTHCKVTQAAIALNGAVKQITLGRFSRYREALYLKDVCLYSLGLEVRSERFARRRFRKLSQANNYDKNKIAVNP